VRAYSVCVASGAKVKDSTLVSSRVYGRRIKLGRWGSFPPSRFGLTVVLLLALVVMIDEPG
jgi:hypothetical protein